MKLPQLTELIDKTVKDRGGSPGFEEDGPRFHLGASIIGKDCLREIFYDWRWASVSAFDGRMLRLFAVGHREEPVFIALLRMIGATVYDRDPENPEKQFRFKSDDGHFAGSMDGKGFNIPFMDFIGLPTGTLILLEFKTHGEKSFIKLQEAGVKKAKRQHYAQMCVYMKAHDLPAALYCAVNKNTSELYFEIVSRDDDCADEQFAKASKLINTRTIPDRISNSPSSFSCTFCSHKMVCHYGKAMVKSCRTCRFSAPVANGQWACTKFNGIIPDSFQITGCEQYAQMTD